MIEFHRADGTVFITDDPGGPGAKWMAEDGRITVFRRERRIVHRALPWQPRVVDRAAIEAVAEFKEVFIEVCS